MRARLQGGDNDLLVAAGPASADPAGRKADVGAVEIEPDALPKLRDHLLGQARVSAGRAALGAAVTFLDAANERVIGVASNVGVGGNHLSHVMHDRASIIGLVVPPLTNLYARAANLPWRAFRNTDGRPRR